MTMNSGHALIVQSKMSHLQQQAQEKDAEVHRQQRELQTLRVRTYCYILAFVTLVLIPVRMAIC